MRGKAKIGYIIGAVIIGVIAVLAVYFALIGFGVIDYRKEKLIFVSGSAIKEYDGTPLVCNLYEMSEGALKDGHTAEIEYSGSQTEVGTGNNNFTVVIKDSNDKDVTDNYIIELQPGTLTVNKREIAVQSRSAQKIYDGEKLSNESADVVAGTLIDGHTLTTSGFASTVKGKVNNTFVATIENGDGEDVTSSYNVTYIFGDLTVSRIPVSLRAVGATAEYDGTPLTDDDYVVRSGVLLDGHRITDVAFSGSQTFVGKSENNITSARVVDENGDDCSDIYEISFYAGELEVTPRRITVLPVSAEKEYDGTPLSSEDGEITYGTLADGDSAEYTSSTALTDVGDAEIDMSLIVTNADGVDVSSCYEVTVGTTPSGGVAKLYVKPRLLVIESGSTTRKFNGLPLVNHTFTVKLGSLADGHEITVDYFASILHAGSTDNDFAASISDGSRNVTENYDLQKKFGTLTVNKCKISVMSDNANKEYNGTPLDCHTYSYAGDLVPGHTVEVSFLGVITEVGSVDNSFHVDIIGMLDDEETSFIDDYEVTTIFGKLTVFPKPITITSATQSKEYDGTPLVAPIGDATSTNNPALPPLASNDEMIIVVTGSQTEVGSSENTISEVIITDKNDKVVSYNYTITKTPGTLTVFEKNNDSDLDADGRLDGEEPEDRPVLDVKSTVSDDLYLRLKSFGDYNGKGFAAAPRFTPLIDGTYCSNYLTSEALSRATAAEIRIVSKGTSDYLLPYYMAFGGTDGYTVQTNDVLYTGDPTVEYRVNYYPYDYSVGMAGFTKGYGRYAGYGGSAESHAHTTYLNVDGMSRELRQYLVGEIRKMGFDKDDPYVIRKVANYIKRSATYSKDYDRAMNDADDIVYAFLTEYKTGVCRHYAAAATLMYRLLGLPARYSIGYVSWTEAGVWTSVSAKSAHAWVEVYVDGIGWVMVEVTGSDGNSNEDDGALTIRPVDMYKQYEGPSDVLESDGQLRGLYNLLAEGYTYSATVIGRQVGAGTSYSSIVDFELRDPTGKVVTDNFDLRFRDGILQIYYVELTVETGDHVKQYDGKPFSDLGEGDYNIVGDLMPGHRIKSVVPTSDFTDVGVAQNSYAVTIVDAAGSNVNGYYRIIPSFGELVIDPCAVRINTEGMSWTFDPDDPIEHKHEVATVTYRDGTPLSEEMSGEFRFTMEFTASITSPGSIANAVKNIVVYDKFDNDVTDRFSFTYRYGMLEVTLE